MTMCHPECGYQRFGGTSSRFVPTLKTEALRFFETLVPMYQTTRCHNLYKKFWLKLIAYFPWYDKSHIENDAANNSYIVACVFVTAVTFLPSRWLAMIGEFLPNRCLATTRGFLPSRCLVTIGGFLLRRCLNGKGTFTEPLPTNNKGDTPTHTDSNVIS
jgi:hypothetical protein